MCGASHHQAPDDEIIGAPACAAANCGTKFVVALLHCSTVYLLIPSLRTPSSVCRRTWPSALVRAPACPLSFTALTAGTCRCHMPSRQAPAHHHSARVRANRPHRHSNHPRPLHVQSALAVLITAVPRIELYASVHSVRWDLQVASERAEYVPAVLYGIVGLLSCCTVLLQEGRGGLAGGPFWPCVELRVRVTVTVCPQLLYCTHLCHVVCRCCDDLHRAASWQEDNRPAGCRLRRASPCHRFAQPPARVCQWHCIAAPVAPVLWEDWRLGVASNTSAYSHPAKAELRRWVGGWVPPTGPGIIVVRCAAAAAAAAAGRGGVLRRGRIFAW